MVIVLHVRYWNELRVETEFNSILILWVLMDPEASRGAPTRGWGRRRVPHPPCHHKILTVDSTPLQTTTSNLLFPQRPRFKPPSKWKSPLARHPSSPSRTNPRTTFARSSPKHLNTPKSASSAALVSAASQGYCTKNPIHHSSSYPTRKFRTFHIRLVGALLHG